MNIRGAVRVLIVDDDQAIRETVRQALEDEGYSCVEARDGATALEILRTSLEPLVVLLDVRMPLLDGRAVLREVAADERLMTRHAYALITANLHVLSPALNGVLKRLSVSIIRKPFDLDVLLDTVNELACRLVPPPPDTSSPSWTAPGR